jgi:hypothetical protein
MFVLEVHSFAYCVFPVFAILVIVLKSNGAGSRKSQTRKERSAGADPAQTENTSNVVRLSAEAKPAAVPVKSTSNARI